MANENEIRENINEELTEEQTDKVGGGYIMLGTCATRGCNNPVLPGMKYCPICSKKIKI